MKFFQLRDIDPPSSLPKLTRDAYELLWISDFWDAPISGMLRITNSLHWFEMTQQNEKCAEREWFRRYAVLKLTSQEIEKETLVHADFQRYVGAHWDYVKLDEPPQFIEGQSNKFYDKHLMYCRSRRFENNEIIYWFEL
jgi:hypothetical protein